MISKILKAAAVGVGALVLVPSVLAPSANATLIGDSVTCSIDPIDSFQTYFCGTTTETVGAGTEFAIRSSSPRWNIDIDGDSIIYNMVAPFDTLTAANDAIVLSGLDWVGIPAGEIIGISFARSGTQIGVAQTSFDAHSVTLRVAGLWTRGSSVTITLETSDSTVPVPEPGTLALFGIGLVGLAAMGRRRKKSVS